MDETHNDIKQSFSLDIEGDVLDDNSRGNNLIVSTRTRSGCALGTDESLLVQRGRTAAGANVTRLER